MYWCFINIIIIFRPYWRAKHNSFYYFNSALVPLWLYHREYTTFYSSKYTEFRKLCLSCAQPIDVFKWTKLKLNVVKALPNCFSLFTLLLSSGIFIKCTLTWFTCFSIALHIELWYTVWHTVHAPVHRISNHEGVCVCADVMIEQ